MSSNYYLTPKGDASIDVATGHTVPRFAFRLWVSSSQWWRAQVFDRMNARDIMCDHRHRTAGNAEACAMRTITDLSRV